ncbi:LysE family translocator [Aestuariivirga litoralis]|uniref:LysE family translocator n=1 Tax=Aestuariivirga litoralis TaxID=2650924 RepID=UPI0018C738C2|nr:LysE family translocator [Aestuariivirga litoralis]MBG1233440.1 LysE family translocator [Aestuariivirga litoralis]
MTYAQNVWLYFVLLFGIIIVPGMDMFFVIANSLTGGRRAGLASVLGINLGGIWHTLFGAFFVGALTTLAPNLITIILIASAAYMAWIGFTLIRSSITVDSIGAAPQRSIASAFTQGFVTCILNPKAYMFVLAVYPTFIQPRFGPVWMQALVMGLLTLVTQFVIYGGLGVAAAKAREFLTGNPAVTITIGRVCGVIFFVVAGFTVWHALNA